MTETLKVNTDPPRYRCSQCGGRMRLDGGWVSCRTCSLSISDRRYGRWTPLRLALTLPSWRWWHVFSPLGPVFGRVYRVRARLVHRIGRHYRVQDGCCSWCGRRP
jgi:hypothetical protein